ncbi:DUF4148 domain-containing protein [Paraburkholderia phosphatilytica]|uniref:DUF4148 domain-containing protein n=1 Tax=Paraburkholderia phosphatilytica TaxID=2282883 RepID=UPI000E470C93|nr:DUF4148 domain-containing protein [Paraburkholderia phosphatilytica]
MKPSSRFVSRLALGATCALCASVAHAQTVAQPYDQSAPLSRAQVRADLRDWLAAGYDPFDWIDYPENAQHAARIVFERRRQAMPAQ